MTTAERIEAAIAARGKATPGPWRVDRYGKIKSPKNSVYVGMVWASANISIIAAAPDLVDEVIRLRAEIARLQGKAGQG